MGKKGKCPQDDGTETKRRQFYRKNSTKDSERGLTKAEETLPACVEASLSAEKTCLEALHCEPVSSSEPLQLS